MYKINKSKYNDIQTKSTIQGTLPKLISPSSRENKIIMTERKVKVYELTRRELTSISFY